MWRPTSMDAIQRILPIRLSIKMFPSRNIRNGVLASLFSQYLPLFSLSVPYSFVYAADTMYCTVLSSVTPQHEAFRAEIVHAVMDGNLSTCIQLFGEGRTMFQASVDYFPNTTVYLDVGLSGTGIQCDKFVTVYWETTAEICWESVKKQCVFRGMTTVEETGNTDCVFRCYTMGPDNGYKRMTLQAIPPRWDPSLLNPSSLCDFKITRN